MDRQEIQKLQSFFRKRFKMPSIEVKARPQKKDSAEKELKPDEESNVKNVKLDKPAKEEKPIPVVFVKQGDSVVTRPVTTGVRDDQYIEITSGLKAGDVVVSGSYKAISKDLESGSKIKLMNQNAKAPAIQNLSATCQT